MNATFLEVDFEFVFAKSWDTYCYMFTALLRTYKVSGGSNSKEDNIPYQCKQRLESSARVGSCAGTKLD